MPIHLCPISLRKPAVIRPFLSLQSTFQVMKRFPLLCAVFMIQPLAMAKPDPFSDKESAPELAVREANPGTHFGLEVVGANHRIHQIVTTSEDEKGNPRPVTNNVAVLADGLNYWEGNQWNETRTEFELQTGYASASKGRHKVNIGGNLNVEGSVALRMPDNQSFRATVHGLAYYDSASGKAVLLSAIQDSQGYLTSPNQVLFKDAFADVKADVRYTYLLNGFEQDVIVREKLPSPTEFGLAPETTQLEVWTEIFDAPKVKIRKEGRPDKSKKSDEDDDEYLELGGMHIPPGQSYRVGYNDNPAQLLTMKKHWAEVEGRRFLVESVTLPQVAATLDQLPVNPPGGAMLRRQSSSRLQALRSLPAKTKANKLTPVKDAMSDPSILASLDSKSDGLVLDYVIKNTTTTETGAGFTFKANETYWIKDNFTVGPFSSITNTMTFEGGTVIKFARYNTTTGVYPQINSDCRAQFLGSMYRPIVFTAEDDHTIGERLTSNASPSGQYAYQSLILRSWSETRLFDINWLRVNRAMIPVNIGGGTGHKLRNVQFVNSFYGFDGNYTDFLVLNGLFANLTGAFHTGTPGTTTVRGENLTISNVSDWLGYDLTPTLINTLLIQVPSATSGHYVGTSTTTLTNCAIESSGTGVFASAFQGNYYLPLQSTNRNAGTTAITSQLATQLKSLTTEAPIQLVGPISMDTTLGPRVARDSDQPDLGYHYAPLDYYGTNIAVNSATLALTNGVAVAGGYPGLFVFNSSANLSSVGRPEAMNRLTTYNTVQEQDTLSITNTTTPPLLLLSGGNIALRFTQLSLPAAPNASRQVFSSSNFSGTISLMDSELRGGWWKAWNYPSSGFTPGVAITNSLIEGSRLEFYQGVVELDQPATLPVTIRSCLFTSSSLDLKRSLYYSSWNFIDNLFDNSTGSLTYFTSLSGIDLLGYNAYTTGTPFLNDWSSRVNMSRDFITGPLGSTYYPTTGTGSGLATLVDQGWNGGAITAATIGLYYHSVLADGSRDGSSRIDIGFHRVVVNSAGLPVDTDGDGIPDVLEDANGNGSVDSGETDPTVSNTLGSGSNQLTVFTPLQ